MASARYENVWELMRRKDFVLVGTVIEEHKCIICKNLLINACSAPCGCRFCTDCIYPYLDGHDKHCPGETENCKEDMINFVRDIQVDHAINTRIAKIIVQCPRQFCDFQDELRKMEDHVQACKLVKIVCPYAKVGCLGAKMVMEKVDEHFNAEKLYHTNLLMNSIDELGKELLSLKAEMELVKRDRDLKQVIPRSGVYRGTNNSGPGGHYRSGNACHRS